MDAKPLRQFVPRGQSRRLVIGDVHGCAVTLEILMFRTLDLQPSDQVFFIGDLVDKGPRSAQVLSRLLALLDKGYQLHFVRGNHEENLLAAEREYEPGYFWGYLKRMGALDLLGPGQRLRAEFRRLFEAMPHHIELDDFHLLHAGLDLAKAWPFEAASDLLELRDWPADLEKQGGKPVLYGHQPTTRPVIERAVREAHAKIPLDNGCVYRHKSRPLRMASGDDFRAEDFGHLCAFELDSRSLFFEPMVDS